MGERERKGKGIIVTWEGDRYEGDWVNYRREGKGTFICNGDKYEGDWVNDKKEGKGIKTDSYGIKYVGDWKRNEKKGKNSELHGCSCELFFFL